MIYEPMLITVHGMSGVGKDSIIEGLTRLDPQIKEILSTKSRAPRVGEVDGVHSHFISVDAFQKKLATGDFLEHSHHHDNLYGIQRTDVEAAWALGCDAISDNQSDGMFQLRKNLPGRYFAILLMPPSRERLFQRLTQRNPELSEEGKKRFKAAEPDLEHLHDPHYVFTNPDMRGSKLTDYDAIFTNDDLEVTTYAVHARILAERAKRAEIK